MSHPFIKNSLFFIPSYCIINIRIGDEQMKKNGFITSALLDGILSLFLILILGTVSILANRKLANDKIKESVLNDVQDINTSPRCFETKTSDLDSNNLQITGYDSTCEKTVYIPATIYGQTVDSIGANAFANKNLINITLEKPVKQIHVTAFTNNDDIIFYIRNTSDQVKGIGSDEEIENASGTTWGAKNATIHWDD